MILLFLDCETTGLDPVIHVPWEVAAVRAEHTDDGRLVVLGQMETFVHLTDDQLDAADPIALEIGRFRERYGEAWNNGNPPARPGTATHAVNFLCDDKPHLVGAVPSFDDRRVGDMMRRCGITPRWHYHLIDIEAMVVGYIARGQRFKSSTSWKSDELSRAIGVDPGQFDRHTAMGDVRWCMAQYAAMYQLEIVDQEEVA